MNKTRILFGGVVVLASLISQMGPARGGFDSSALYPDAPDYAKDEAKSLETLRGGDPAKKAVACKQLAIHGTKQAVPELAKLLADEQLSSWARVALEAIPDAAADEALLKASQGLKGKLLVGTINTIGVRRDAKAVEALSGRLKDADPEVASAAAVALGKIGNKPALTSLRQALKAAPVPVKAAVAEGCVLCAEQLLADGKSSEALEIYDEVRRADVPKQRKIEATRGSIVSQGERGVPLLVEQLKSDDKAMFQLGLKTARELEGKSVADALAAQLANLPPERAALLIVALGDRPGAALPPAVVEAARKGSPLVRLAAIQLLGRLGNESQVAPLLAIAAEANAEAADAAKAALAGLQGAKINAELAARLAKAEGKELAALVEIVGQRRIEATDALVKALANADEGIRRASLASLGATVNQRDLGVLIAQAVAPKNPGDGEAARQALMAACVRMPDREACAAELATALPKASAETKAKLLEILGAVSGPKALAAIDATIKSGDDQLKDAGTKLLGNWMTVDAAPVLLEAAKDPSSAKYQVRALRGYLRLARQFPMSNAERAAMCEKALAAAKRPEERKLVVDILARYPSEETLKVALAAAQDPALKQDAARAVMAIAQQQGTEGAGVEALLAKIGLDPMKVEVVKADYASGDVHRDVTETLKQRVHDLPLITLPKSSYNKSFGGDPAPGAPKKLIVQYKINGKAGTATFAENEAIMLPTP